MASPYTWRDPIRENPLDPIRERTRKCSGVAVTLAQLIQKDSDVIFSKTSGKLKHPSDP